MVSYIFEVDRLGPEKMEETLTLWDLTENPKRSHERHLFINKGHVAVRESLFNRFGSIPKPYQIPNWLDFQIQSQCKLLSI